MTATQIGEVKSAMRHAEDRCHFERYPAVYLYLTGYKMKDIAKIIDRAPETVGIYVSSYEERGLEGLALGHSTGKPSKMSKEQQAFLLDVVSTQVPADVGFTAKYNWTLALITQFVEEKWGGPIPYAECPVFSSGWVSVIHAQLILWRRRILKNRECSWKKHFQH